MDNRRKTSGSGSKVLSIATVVLLLLVMGAVAIFVYKYAPTSEHISAEDYFDISGDESAVMIDGDLMVREDGDAAAGFIREGESYVRLDILKGHIDDGYVYDKAGRILRYATSDEVISVTAGSSDYLMGRESVSVDSPIILEDGDIYISCSFVSQFSGAVYATYTEPNRIVFFNDDFDPTYAALTRDTAIRRLGGPKSKVIKDGKKDDIVLLIEKYGKWTQVATMDGYLGCVMTTKLKETEHEREKSSVAKQTHDHIKVDFKINMLWHQISGRGGNVTLGSTLERASEINVISPTWFRISDNDGNISDFGSTEYVDTCHSKGIQVWALVSNFEVEGVDSTTVLNSTSSRDNLVNSLIAKAIAYNLDGINVDFELIPKEARDGYIQFIRELSIKCEKNDVILSVDNYVPNASNEHYNRKVQADYADYVVIMAYDEHYTGSDEAGSNSSMPYVRDAVDATLKDVPADQFILGLPFYTREFVTTESGISNNAMGMNQISSYMKSHDLTATWLDKEEQNYAEYRDATGALHQIWIEDSKSLARKMTLIKDNSLAGGAFWKAGFEEATIWDVIVGYIN